MGQKNLLRNRLLIFFIVGVYAVMISVVGFLHQHDFYTYSAHKDTIQKVIHPVNDGCIACHFITGHELANGNSAEFALLSVEHDPLKPLFLTFETTQTFGCHFTSRGPPIASIFILS